jgi:hypothetical protein
VSVLRLVVVMAVVTALDAAEPETPRSGTGAVPATDPVGLSDFIIPIARDVRLGYSINVGRYHRSQDEGEGTDSHFIEHGLWMSYVGALSGPGRVLSGRAEWRAEAGLLVSQANVSNPNGSIGKIRTAALDVGIGPAWAITENGTSRLEVELLPFVGIGLSRYDNDYSSESLGFRGTTSVTATGLCMEYGIKANLMWCWANGWGAALHVGLVQRVNRLEGDSETQWNNGAAGRSDYTSDDVLSGVRFGLFVAKRF